MKKFFTLVTLILSIELIANDYYLIDVRTPEEFKSGYLEDAINIEWQDIKKLNKEIKKDDKIYLYCRSGNRSGKATDILINLGYKNVKNIGGLKEASESLNLRILSKIYLCEIFLVFYQDSLIKKLYALMAVVLEQSHQ